MELEQVSTKQKEGLDMCCMVGRVPTNARDMEEELHTNNITQKDCFHQLISISNEVCIVQIV